mgnify:CR=1 FL=1
MDAPLVPDLSSTRTPPKVDSDLVSLLDSDGSTNREPNGEPGDHVGRMRLRLDGNVNVLVEAAIEVT